MADGEGGDGGREGGGSAEWQPIYERVEAMVSESQARAEALAADRARQEAADRVQREVARRLQRSVQELQAAAREKDAEMDRLRAEAADARRKLQADAAKRGRWEAAYLDLLLGANQKLAELRDGDMEESIPLAETPNSKETESCTKLNQNIVDHVSSDLSAELRKLKQAYETLSSKEGKQVSALLLEKDSVRSQLDIMQQDYAELLKNKKVEAAQPTEAALKLQQSVDELKLLAQKKDFEIGRLQAEAVEAKKNQDKDLCALVSEKDHVHNQLSIMQQNYTELLKNKKVEEAQATEAALKLQKSIDELKVLAQKKDDEIVRLRAEAVDAKKKLIKMQSLVKAKDDETRRLKGRYHESIQNLNKDISQTHKNFRSDDPAVRSKSKNNGLMQMVEDYISQTETIGKDWQDEPRQKRRRVSFISNDDEQSGSDEDDDGQSGSDDDDDEQNGSDENGEEQSRSDEDGDGQSRRGEYDMDEQSGRNEETMNNPVQKSLGIPKRKRDASNARFANGKAIVKVIDRTKWYCYHIAPAPLCSQKLQILDGRYFVMSTGNWAQYVKDVKDIVVDQPDKHKEFIRFLCNFENWRIEDVARTMAVLLDGHPELICRFNRFLPKYWQIEIEEDEEHHPDESAVAAASLIKLKEAEQPPNRERV